MEAAHRGQPGVPPVWPGVTRGRAAVAAARLSCSVWDKAPVASCSSDMGAAVQGVTEAWFLQVQLGFCVNVRI